MNPWISIARGAIGLVPAIILVVFAGTIMGLGLALGPSRRAYALATADHFTSLAYAIIGMPRSGTWPEPPPSTQPAGEL
jgi:hypothetical protein